jgi:hypothetical protein
MFAGIQVLFCQWFVYAVPVLVPVPNNAVIICHEVGFSDRNQLLIKLLLFHV